jgi:hypothetical protein
MKFARLFLRSLSLLNRPVFSVNKQQIARNSLATFGAGLAAYYSLSKVFPDELIVVETEDNLKDGEVRELLVGPKP